MRPGGPAVEADHARQPKPGRGLQVADPPAEAEPERVDAFGIAAGRGPKVGDRGGDVCVDCLRAGLDDVLLVGEVGVPPLGAGRPREEIERHCIHAGLREAERQLLVVRVQAANVRDDHHAGARRLLCAGTDGRELGPVGAGEGQLLAVDRGAANRGDRWSGVTVEAHGIPPRRL